MKWNVMLFRNGEMKPFNVFQNYLFADAVTNIINDPVNENKTREELSEEIRRKAQWQFWSRCEYEYIATEWPPAKDDKGYKLDVYEQLMANWDRFMDYIMLWRHNYLLYEENLPKQDHSFICSKDDDNDAHCWGCMWFQFPVGCKVNEEIELKDVKDNN